MNSEAKKTILLVEDNTITAITENMMLRKYGFEVIIADSGENAIDVINGTPDIDLILMDIDLGKGIDGPKTTEIILKEHDLPVIFLSAHTEREVVEKTEGITSYGYIVKNSGETVLIASIKMAFRLFEAKKRVLEKEAALVQSETRFRHISEITSDIAYSCRVDKNSGFCIDWITGAVEKITGYTGDEIKSTCNWSFLVINEDMALFERNVTGLLPGTHGSCELRIKHRDGNTVWISSSAECVMDPEDPEGCILYGGLKDISERKQAEEILRTSEEKFAAAFQHVPALVTISDIEDGRLISINDEFVRVSGFTREEAVGRTSTELGWIHSRDRVKILELLEKDGRIADMDLNVYRKDGQPLKCVYNSELITINGRKYILSLSKDITEHRQIESALIKTEESFRKIFEEGRIGIVTSDREFRFDMVNRAFCAFTGYSEEELKTMTFRDITHPDYLKQDIEYLKKLELGEIPFYRTEKQYIRKTGETVWGSLIASVIHDKEGNFVNYLVMIEDINELKLMSELMITRKQQMQTIADNLPAYISYVDARDLSYIMVNRGFAAGFGREPEQITGMLVNEILGDEAFSRALPYIERARAGERVSYENVVPVKDGQRWFRLNYIPEKDKDGTVRNIIVQAMDVTELKETGTMLLESELRYRSLFENAPVGIFHSTVEGKIIRVNAEFARIMGYSSPEELQQAINRSSVSETIYDRPEERADLIEKVMVVPGSWISTERKYRRKDGTYITAQLIFRVIPGKPDILEGFVEDISERKLALETLEKSEEKYRMLTENMLDVVWILDTETWNFRYLSPSVFKLRGFTAEEIMSGPIDDAVDKDKIVELKAIMLGMVRDYLSGRGPADKYYTSEVELIRKDGSTVWTEAVSRCYRNPQTGHIEIHGVSRDITKRRKVQQELFESEKLFRSLSENIPGYVCSFLPDSTITFCNRLFAEMKGSGIGELTNRRFYDYLGRKTSEYLKFKLEQLTPGNPMLTDEYQGTGPDGAVQHQEWRIGALFGGSGKPYRYIAVGFDITERKHAENQIRSLLREKELLLREVHHRIKNFMNTVCGLINLQKESTREQAAVKSLEDASNRVQNMMLLYDKLYQSTDFRQIPVKDYIPQLVDEIIDNFPNRSQVKIIKQVDDFIIDGKILQPLGIIINELITNIMKYAFKGRSKGLITVKASREGDRIILEVRDNGVGMPEPVNYKNITGFGLMLVEMLTEQIGGTLRIERDNGTGIIIESDVIHET